MNLLDRCIEILWTTQWATISKAINNLSEQVIHVKRWTLWLETILRLQTAHWLILSACAYSELVLTV